MYYCPKCGDLIGGADIAVDESGVIDDLTVLFKCERCDMRFEIYGCRFRRMTTDA